MTLVRLFVAYLLYIYISVYPDDIPEQIGYEVFVVPSRGTDPTGTVNRA